MSNGTENLFAEERREQITEYVKKHGKVTVQQLCDVFGVSSATIRNDLRELDRQRQLVRTHGGALGRSQTRYEVDIDHRSVEAREAKQAIAAAAVTRIDAGDTIILDTGTTTLELAKVLSQVHNLTVVTNDLRIALVLESYPNVQVIVTGGRLRDGFHCTVGSGGRAMLDTLSVDKAFMGANSFSPEFGASTPDLDTADTKKAMIAIADTTVLLADSRKFEQTSLARFAVVEDIDVLVTESISDSYRVAVEQAGIEVVNASLGSG
ncbi:MAG: DeoR/GlpR family DNA-binding transcription regulator [Spirochaetaceae bacterium]